MKTVMAIFATLTMAACGQEAPKPAAGAGGNTGKNGNSDKPPVTVKEWALASDAGTIEGTVKLDGTVRPPMPIEVKGDSH